MAGLPRTVRTACIIGTSLRPSDEAEDPWEDSMVAPISRRAVLALGIVGPFLAGMAVPAAAQPWPSRPVTMMVPYAPGASNDTFTRAVSEILSQKLGQPFVVENRPGAGGFTGTNAVSRGAPDGYTFVEMPNSIVGFKPFMGVDLDPLKSLTPVAALARAPTALVVPSSLPVKSVEEFIEHAKAHPTQTFYGYAGVGTTQHQHMELFKSVTGLQIRGVNYKSSADAQTDLLAGRLHAMFVTVASTLGQIEGGQLRLLAYTDSNFPPDAPKATTMAELGIKGMEKAQIWWGLFAPPGLPDNILRAMNAAVNESLKEPSFVALLAKSGATPSPVTPEGFVEMIRQEVALVEEFAPLLKSAAN
jgi:tripartite-type tricarboxylate transporter receptor subunit TctC